MSLPVGRIARVLAVCLVLFLTACGSDDGQEKGTGVDRCTDVECSGGVCSPESGECINPEVCDDENPCLENYTCEAQECVLTPPCEDVECDRGVCDVNSGECVNSEVCTKETQDDVCLEGFTCFGQECVDENTFCDVFECERGVCEFESQSCVNAGSCSSDMECVEGSVCSDGQCADNVCDAGTISCVVGVCDPLTGDCVNAEGCTQPSQCTDGFYCIEGDCIDQDEACGECPGNQVCDYNETQLVTTCAENSSGCQTSVDCDAGRVCRNAACGPPPACEEDSWEPNDDEANAVDLFAERLDGTRVDASVCSDQDVDVFAYDVRENSLFTGTLLADVQIESEDIGLGELELELTDSEGNVVDSVTTTDGYGRIEYSIGALDQDTFYLSVSSSGTLSSAGVRYGAFMSMFDPSLIEACTNADPLEASNDGNSLTGRSTALAPSCASEASAGEDIYRFELTEPRVVRMVLTPTSDADLTLSVRRQCEVDSSELACRNNRGASNAELYEAALEPGAYYVLVQGTTTASGGDYNLSFDAATPVCTPADNACIDMTSAQVCNPLGTALETEQCDSSCDPAIGRCAREEADICETAIDASSGYSGTLNFNQLTNDYSPGTSCVPASSGAGTTAGPDAAFLVDLPDGHGLQVDASPTGFDDLSIYILRDCGDVLNSCFGGVSPSSGEPQLVYQNTSGGPESFYVIVDMADSFSYSSADIEISTGPVICTPQDVSCNVDTLEECSAAGLQIDSTNCQFGCESGACNAPPNNQCGSGAIDVGGGGVFTGMIEDYTDDYDPTSAGCTGFRATGGDAVYTVSGNDGDIVTATLTPSFDGSLYAVTDCNDLLGTCLDGDDRVGVDEVIQFTLTAGQPVNIIVDGFSSSASGAYSLDVQVESPDCFVPGEVLGCQDIDTMEYCDRLGFTQTYDCDGSCVGGVCDIPTGDRCIDPIVLTPGSTFVGNFGDFENDVNPGVGGCILDSSSSQTGPDAVFAVDLASSQTLEATLSTSTSNAGMYVVSNCQLADSSCLWAEPASDELEFFAETAGRYFLVVDTQGSSSADFELDIDTRFGDVCQPGGASCDEVTDTLTRCTDDGQGVLDVITCPTGCSGQYCNAPSPPNETCADAQAISAPVQIADTFARFNGDYNPGTQGCVGTATPGNDSVYEVVLGPDEVVTVDVVASGSTRPAVYFVDDCTDVAASCLGGYVAESGANSVRAGYYSSTGETVSVIVDATSSFADDPFLIEFDFQPSECTPGDTICADSDTLETCSDFAVYESEPCYFGCSAGACDPAPNDDCAGAIDATGGGVFEAPIEEYTNTYDPTSSGCTGFSAAGYDAVYAFTPEVDDVVQISLDAPYDSSLYVVTDCSMIGTTCLAGSDAGGVEGVSFIASDNVPHYVIADAYTSAPSGVFELEITYGPSVCTPNEAVCTDGSQLDICNGIGLAFDDSHTCSNDCTVGESICNNGSGDVCYEAIDANATGTFSGDFQGATNDYSPVFSGGCTGYDAVGPDFVYYVDLIAGEQLTATLTATDATQDTSLYVLSDCTTDVESACLVGEDVASGGSGTGESVTYTASEDERVYIVADNYVGGASLPTPATFDLLIDVQ